MNDVPDTQIYGAAYKVSVQTDTEGAVIVAYTRDPETGRIGRSWIRLNPAGADYVRRRLGGQ
ncbi:hypothetical protein NRF20_00040 (plasmid) [Streptomyces sp. R-74717]|uniref:hypothetical protein n=1 Tax=Streptomyces sp. R-74717 TaxID=2969820 RepID=UPI0039B65CDF